MGRLGAQRLGKFDAVHLGHEVVHDHEGRVKPLELVQRPVRIAKGDRRFAEDALDHGSVELEGRLVVVNDYYPVHMTSVPIFSAGRIIGAKTFGPIHVKRRSSG